MSRSPSSRPSPQGEGDTTAVVGLARSLFGRQEVLSHLVAKREKLGFGKAEGLGEFVGEAAEVLLVAGGGEFLEFLAEVGHTVGAEVEAHAFEGMGVEGEFLGVAERAVDLGDALGGGLKKEINEFVKNVVAGGGRAG